MDKNRNIAGIVIGVVLVVAGILSLLGRYFDFINWDNSWPLIVIGVGAVLFVIMLISDKSRGGLAVPASILLTIGLVLTYMNITDRWEAWSYAWALIICAAGVGVFIQGAWSSQPDLRKRGLKTMRDGAILFLVFGAIMELIFSYSKGLHWASAVLWGGLLGILGLVLLTSRLVILMKGEAQKVDLFWPILMIGVSIIVVLGYFNILPEENLTILLNLWPVFLIVAGISLILRDRSSYMMAGLAVFVVAAIFIVAIAGGNLGLRSIQFLPFDTDVFNFDVSSGERINGSGNVISESRTVSGFDRVQLEIPAKLEIQQGPSEALMISGDDNILPLLSTNVSFGQLTIRYKAGANVRVTRPIQLTLTVKNLSELQNSSSGNVAVGPLTTGNFHLLLSSSGDVQFENIQAEKITAELTSSGDINISGAANQLDLRVSSSGTFQAGDLRVQEVAVRLTSSGDVTVWAVDTLRTTITSSGDVFYYGSPALNTSLTSSGRLIARGEK